MFGSSVIREGRWGDPNSSALFFFKGLTWQDAVTPPTGIKAVGRQTCLKCKYPNRRQLRGQKTGCFFIHAKKKQNQTNNFDLFSPQTIKFWGGSVVDEYMFLCFVLALVFFFVMFLYCHVLINSQSSG